MSLSAPYLSLAEEHPRRTFSSGRTLVYQSEIPRTGYLLESGTLRVYSLDTNGEESNITFLKEDAIFPIEYIFGKTSSSLYYYTAVTDIEVVAIPTEDIRDIIENNTELLKAVLDGLTTKYVGAEMHIQALEQTHAKEKIIRILQYLVLRFGVDAGENYWLIDLPLKQHDIANMVGLTRETTATELGKLKKSGIISYTSFLYTVNMDALSKLVGIDQWEDIEIS